MSGKKWLISILCLTCMATAGMALTGCQAPDFGPINGSDSTHFPTTEGKILFHTLTVNETEINGVFANSVEEFSFVDEIKVSGNRTYIVASDKYGSQVYLTKIVPLAEGDNVFYVFEMSGENIVKTYTVTLRRRPMYSVSFYTNGGTYIQSQTVEEGKLAVPVNDPKKAGYTFTGWNYNLAQPITQDVQVSATWQANTNTAYTVKYYLENVENSQYTLHETVNLTGTTDTTASAEIKEYTHFTYNRNKSMVRGNINGDGSCVLSVYYTRDSYLVNAEANNTKAGTVSGQGNYKYDDEVTLTATTNAGYTWLGWYDGETRVSKTMEYTVKAEENKTYRATWQANTNTAYTVKYYLENVENSQYTLHETVNLTGTTDTTATATIKDYDHFTYKANGSTISGNINGDGSRVLSVYYTRDKYSLTINDTSAGKITGNGTYKYGTTVSATVSPYLAYDFLGWYNGEEYLSKDLSYSFTIEGNTVAKLSLKEEMEIFNFTTNETKCEVTSIKDTTITELVIPDCVTSTSIYFSEYFDLRKVVIGNGITEIGCGEFADCGNLAEIVIGENVTYIGGRAFSNCVSLTEIVIPDSVTSIGDYAFNGCTSLTEIVIPDSIISIDSGAFTGCNNLQYTKKNGLKYLGNPDNPYLYLAGSYGSYSTLTVESGCKMIGGDLFYDNYDGGDFLGTVIIPEGVRTIEAYAFSGCIYLKNITIPNSVERIGRDAFHNCRSLQYNEKNGLKYLGNENNPYVYLADTASTSITTATIESGCKVIGESAFSGCSSLTEIVIPNSVTSIEDFAFYGCSSLTEIVIPDSVTNIEGSTFSSCPKLKIYCEAESKPDGWDSYWNSSRPVVWGYKVEEQA